LSLKLLVVSAHPDDECYAFGGALALAAMQGAESYVICLTDGQAATNRGSATSGTDLGRMRREEFAASCDVLGVTQHQLLDYQDGQLEFVDFSHAAGMLVEHVRRIEPNVIVTFGQDGGLNTHADHTMVSALTTAAFHWSGHSKRYPEAGEVWQPQRLFHASTNFFIPGRQPPLPLPWTVTLDVRPVLDLKRQAFAKHASQAALMEGTKDLFDEYGNQEFYTLVAEAGYREARQMTTLFEGLIP
jgi:LmbE family N-acetylglucosaminyl deacetylase